MNKVFSKYNDDILVLIIKTKSNICFKVILYNIYIYIKILFKDRINH